MPGPQLVDQQGCPPPAAIFIRRNFTPSGRALTGAWRCFSAIFQLRIGMNGGSHIPPAGSSRHPHGCGNSIRHPTTTQIKFPSTDEAAGGSFRLHLAMQKVTFSFSGFVHPVSRKDWMTTALFRRCFSIPLSGQKRVLFEGRRRSYQLDLAEASAPSEARHPVLRTPPGRADAPSGGLPLAAENFHFYRSAFTSRGAQNRTAIIPARDHSIVAGSVSTVVRRDFVASSSFQGQVSRRNPGAVII